MSLSSSPWSKEPLGREREAPDPFTAEPGAPDPVATRATGRELGAAGREQGALEARATVTSSELCLHCGLSVPDTRIREKGHQFCCAGCETVYALLQGAGLSEYYGFRARLGESGKPVPSSSSESAAEFDSLAFQELYVEQLASGEARCELLLQGVHCAACVWLVERLPRLEPAVASARLDMARSVVELHFDPKRASLSRIALVLAQMGYPPRAFRGGESARAKKDELRALLIRIGVAGAVAGNVMLMAFALYSGAVGFGEAETMDSQTRRFFEWASLVVSLPALWASGLFFRGAWASLRTRTPHMDLPIALGILAGFVWGIFATITDQGHIYFDSITTLVFFLLVGRYVSRRHQFHEAGAAELFSSVVPSLATLVTDEGTHQVEAGSLPLGSRIQVESGQVLPVDGVVDAGSSSLDKSLLSGESVPVAVSPGDSVEAGSLNLGARLLITTVRAGADTRIGRFLREVERAQGARTPLVAQADRIAGGFTVFVLALSVLVLVLWWNTSPLKAAEHALTLLIVACPCALGLATPLTVSAAIGQAAAQKKIVFAPDALEKMARPMDIVIDKTGTLTEGKLRVIGWHTRSPENDDGALKGLVLAAEEGAHHPAARALREFLRREGVTPAVELGEVTEELGRGLSAPLTSAPGAPSLFIGSPRGVLKRAEIDARLRQVLEEAPAEATPVLVAVGAEVRVVILLADQLAPDAARTLHNLTLLGHRLHLLSGDDPRTVQAIAALLSRERAALLGRGEAEQLFAKAEPLFTSVEGGVTPEQKLLRVAEIQAQGGKKRRVAMVGDGVNDAGALRRADVGISVRGAAEVSRLSSDVYLSAPELGEIYELFLGARRTLKVIRRGMVFSLVYNAVGITSAALGLIGPLFAAVLMPLSSLTVVTNAYRSRPFSRARAQDHESARAQGHEGSQATSLEGSQSASAEGAP